MQKIDIGSLYNILYEEMGPQGWWPAESKPEIIVGAILVQNTNWNNVKKSLQNLRIKTNFDPKAILYLTKEEIELLVRPSGFYVNKSQTIIDVFNFFEQYGWHYENLQSQYGSQLRNRLLDLPGIGPETADVLLLYVFDQPIFISDKYARTMFQFLTNIEYKDYQHMSDNVKLTQCFNFKMSQELHGLIDEFGKQYLKNEVSFKKSFLHQRRTEICYI